MEGMINLQPAAGPGLRRFSAALLVLAFFSAAIRHSPAAPLERESRSQKKVSPSLFERSRLKVAVTDSGLGGLSVLAEAARRMKEARIFEAVDFVFFNALFSKEGGYNSLKTREEKIRVWDSALESLRDHFRPDILLIGCNTLSVLYPDTRFSRQTDGLPVFGIVDSGVELIAQGLKDHPEASVLIFGTPTTISERTYPNELERRGFDAARIRSQSCPELENFIENNPQGEETGMLISGEVSEAVEKLPSPPPPLLISLNCTHYGYSLPFWEKAFEEAGIRPLAFLNPNSRMTDVLFNRETTGRFEKTDIRIRVVSMVEISGPKIDSLAPWLERLSPETADALRRYEHKPDLFEWQSLISR
jgi:glutamate racemase